MFKFQCHLKSSFKTRLVLIFGLISFQISAQQFSKEDVLHDLEYLKNSLENTHFNLYAYTSKEEFKRNFKTLKKEIKKDSFSLLEATSLLQKVISKANNAHTRINFPVQQYIIYAQSGGTLFPLEVAIENGKAWVRKNWSTQHQINIGAELKRINGEPIDQILEKIYPQISAERPYFKHAQIESLTVPRFYWQVFGEQDNFEVDIVQNGIEFTFQIKAIKAMEGFEMKRDDIIKQNWDFKFMSNSVAYLRPGGFGGDEDKYRRFIDSTFVEINAKPAKHLIIDLRNHPGGDDSFGDYLVSYIADKPFKWTSRFQLKTSAQLKEQVRQKQDTTQAYWKSILEHKDGEIYEYNFDFYEPQPKVKRFKGEVYVLVNRLSFSQSTVTAAQIQDYDFGTIVGEETGEYATLYASIFNYNLPKTGISVDVSKGKIERVNGDVKNQGVVPDIIISDHLLDKEDEILDGIIQIITNN